MLALHLVAVTVAVAEAVLQLLLFGRLRSVPPAARARQARLQAAIVRWLGRPSRWAVLASGILLIFVKGIDPLTTPWLLIKLVLVAVMSLFDDYLEDRLAQMQNGEPLPEFHYYLAPLTGLGLLGLASVTVLFSVVKPF